MDGVRSVRMLSVLAFIFLTTNGAFNKYKVDINTKQCVYETDHKFLSIALDSDLIRNRWLNFSFSSEKLHNLAKGLAPAYLRIGGTNEDFLLFNPNEIMHKKRVDSKLLSRKILHDQRGNPYLRASDKAKYLSFTNFTMTTEDVDNLFTFAKKSGLNIIFGLNVLLRDSNTQNWNSTNAQQLMKYITGRGFSCDWELGNEPFDLKSLVNWTITGRELALDFKILRQILNEHPDYGHMILGPDVSSPWQPRKYEFFREYLTHINKCINGMTYHQYYTSNKANVSEFYNPVILDDLITNIQQLNKIVTESGTSSIELWLGETSSAYDGGVPGVSNSYIAGFTWLDKLGVAARLKHKIVVRQTFYGGSSYSLINRETLDPFPDYWSGFLYKKLVGSRVLEVHDGTSLGRTIRVYAHCTSTRSGYVSGSLVLIALNTQHNATQLVLTDGLEKLSVDQYLLTPGESDNLTSQTVRLNGKLLIMVNDTFLPNVKPEPIIPLKSIILPPVSYGFFVVPNAQVEACQNACGKQSSIFVY